MCLNALTNLENDDIEKLLIYFEDDTDLIEQISKLRGDRNSPPKIIVMPNVRGIDFHNLKGLKSHSPSCIQYLSTELGRIAVKDYVSQIGDRILGKTNPGNLMLKITLERKIDEKERLVLIDNVFDLLYPKKTMADKSKVQIIRLIVDQVSKFLETWSPEIDTKALRKEIEKGIKTGVKELHDFLDNRPKIAHNLNGKQERVVLNIRNFLEKMINRTYYSMFQAM